MSRKQFSQEDKHNRIIDRYAGRPFMLVLVMDRRFRLIFLFLLMLVLLVGLAIPKIWRVSPKEFVPEVRISLLDYLQSQALARTARRHQAAGQFEDASHAWRAAVANHPAHRGHLRGFLENELRRADHSSQRPEFILGYAHWLLDLTSTNATDLDLSARLYHRLGRLPHVVNLLRNQGKPISDIQRGILLRALFETGRMKEFEQCWMDAPPAVRADPEVALYHAAWMAGWGSGRDAAQGQSILGAGLRQPDNMELVCRLRMKVASKKRRLNSYREMLDLLRERGADQLRDHMAYWRLLAQSGQPDAARELAHQYSYPPASYEEFLDHLGILEELGLQELADDLIDRHALEFRNQRGIWLVCADFFARRENWDRMRWLALQLRENAELDGVMAGFSYYLEGWAEAREGRAPAARDKFDRASEYRLHPPGLAIMVASRMASLNFPDPAAKILAQVEDPMHDNARFWSLSLHVASQLSDADRMLHCAENAYRADPDDWAVSSNYAAMLMLRREQLGRVIPLTLKVYNQNPSSVVARANHGLALLLNGRMAEAEELVRSIDCTRLPPEQRAAVELVRLELFLERGDRDLAEEILESIDASQLSDLHGQHLERLRRRLKQDRGRE